MNMQLPSITIATLLLLTGCGGGESGGGSTSSVSTSPEPLSVANLEVGYDNELESVYHLRITVPLTSSIKSASYLSLCDSNKAQGDISKIDYSQCFLKTALSESSNTFDLRIANHHQELTAVIWRLEDGKPPLVFNYRYDQQKQSYWVIE